MEVKQTKHKALKLVLGILLAAALAVGLYFGIKALNGKDSGEQPSTQPVTTGETGAVDPTATEPEPDPAYDPVRTKEVYTDENLTADDPRLDTVVAECGDYTLTSRQAQVLYFMQYYNLQSYYGGMISMLGLDSTKPLYEQSSLIPGLSWEQAFLFGGVSQNLGLTEGDIPAFQVLAALASKANAEGVSLSAEEEASFEEFLTQMNDMAVTYGFTGADEMLQADMGVSVTLEDYVAFQRLYSLAVTYDSVMAQDMEPSEEEILAYYEANPDSFADIDPEDFGVNVRHILILSDRDGDEEATDQEKAEAKAQAEALLEEFLRDPTEERFAAMANEHSEDPGSNTNGGLYEGVTQGQMVPTFNDWCFDGARQPGDTGIVETDYGFHVMYFSGTELSWKSAARDALRTEQAKTLLDSICAEYPLTVRYEDVVLAPLPLATAEAE